MIRYCVVDDAAFIREIVKSCLVLPDFECIGEAADGLEAIQIVRETLPDLIVLDLVLPFKNGIEVAKKVKEIFPDVKIVGISSLVNTTIRAQMKEAQFDAFIEKPFTREQIMNVSSALFQIQRVSNYG